MFPTAHFASSAFIAEFRDKLDGCHYLGIRNLLKFLLTAVANEGSFIITYENIMRLPHVCGKYHCISKLPSFTVR